MSDPSPADARRLPGRHIPLPNGDVLVPRREFAKETLRVSEKTARRMNLPTTYIANIAHVARNESLAQIAKGIRREPKRRK
jgi:hypothetical protein